MKRIFIHPLFSLVFKEHKKMQREKQVPNDANATLYFSIRMNTVNANDTESKIANQKFCFVMIKVITDSFQGYLTWHKKSILTCGKRFEKFINFGNSCGGQQQKIHFSSAKNADNKRNSTKLITTKNYY